MRQLSSTMLLPVVMLWSMVVYFEPRCAATFNNADPSKHLCGKVTSGRFGDIDLKSITYYNHHQVVIFEGDLKYFMPTSDITKMDMNIPETYLRWNDVELESAASEIPKGESIKSVYSFNDGGILMTFITTNKFRYAFHKNKRDWPWQDQYTKKMKTETLPKGQPDYAIVHDQDKEDLRGYVIHRDIYQNTNNFVIYQLKVEDWSIKLPDVGQKSIAHQFHLERTDNPAKAVFVHSSQYGSSNSDPRNHLFNSLPRGFILHKQMYLFDTDLGCVYILKGWIRHNLTEIHLHITDYFTIDRVNVPYEQFFKCPEQYKVPDSFYASHPAKRCETSNVDVTRHVSKPSSDAASSAPVSNDNSPDIAQSSISESSSEMNSGGTIYTDKIPEESKEVETQWVPYLGGAIVIALLIVLAVVLVRKRAKKGKSDKSGKNKNKTPKGTPKKPKSKASTSIGGSSNGGSTSSTGSKVSKTTALKMVQPGANSCGQSIGSESTLTSVNRDFSTAAAPATPKAQVIKASSQNASIKPKTTTNNNSNLYGGSLISSSLLPTSPSKGSSKSGVAKIGKSTSK